MRSMARAASALALTRLAVGGDLLGAAGIATPGEAFGPHPTAIRGRAQGIAVRLGGDPAPAG